MAKNDIRIFEVREGDEVIARFRRKTPAEKRKKELKRSGRKAKLFTLFVRKFVPLEEKPLPKGMEYFNGIEPFEIPPEAASQLRMGWEHIREVFYIGSYRDGCVCKPYDRTGDLSIQPRGDHLALCYHYIPDNKTYLVLDRIDWISVKPICVEITGIAKAGYSMMLTLRIVGAGVRKEPKEQPFKKGWYSLKSGALFWIGESDKKLTKEQGSDRLAGMFPYVVVYPALKKGDRTVWKGFLPLHDGEALDDYVKVRLGSGLSEYLGPDDGVLKAVKTGNGQELKRLGETHAWIMPYASMNRRLRIMKTTAKKKEEKDDGSDITDREIDYWFDDREGKRCRRSSGPGTAGLLPTP